MLSVVVPCYNEQESVSACHARLTAVLRSIEQTNAPGEFAWEIVYVDDGSHDATYSLLQTATYC